MAQLSLPVAPFVNRGLFRDHYLHTRLPGEPFWALDVEPLRAALASLLDRVVPTAPALNEATLETDLIRPVLEQLGFEPATWVKKQAAPSYAPDYTVFASKERRDAALVVGLGRGTFFEHALCLVEAKSWGLDLDRAAGRERSPMAQLKRYLVESGVSWGILTNGVEWRLLARDGPVDVYYAVRLPDLARSTDGSFRYFAHLFSREAFGAQVPARVRGESVRFAERLEEDLRERVREALAALGKGLLAGERVRRRAPAGADSAGPRTADGPGHAGAVSLSLRSVRRSTGPSPRGNRRVPCLQLRAAGDRRHRPGGPYA